MITPIWKDCYNKKIKEKLYGVVMVISLIRLPLESVVLVHRKYKPCTNTKWTVRLL